MADIQNFDIMPNEDEEFVVDFGEVINVGGGGGTSDFNDLTNRPKYDGTTMTGDTEIPKVPTKTSELTNDGSDGTSTYVEADSLSVVATTGDYDDLTNKPTIPPETITILTADDYNYTFDGHDCIAAWLLPTGTYKFSDDLSEEGFEPILLQMHGTPEDDPEEYWVERATTPEREPLLIVQNTDYGDWQEKSYHCIDSYNDSIFMYPINEYGNFENGSVIVLNQPFQGATEDEYGITGLVPMPSINEQDLFLQGSGQWAPIPYFEGTDGIEEGKSGAVPTPTVDDADKYLNSNGAWESLPMFQGTIGGSDGEAGLVPAPSASDLGKFLSADGTWASAGGGGPTVVQTTGTSTTDVMSQNATTSMIFDDPSTARTIKIGTDTSSGSQGAAVGFKASSVAEGIAVGRSANSTGLFSAAVGSYSVASRNGEFNIGTGSNTYGYNNTSYRVLGGVYDGQDAHDAATKGQLDAISSYSETEVNTGATWIDGKTIYKKSYQQTITGNSQTFSLGITNLYEVVKMEAIWHAGGTLANGMPTTTSFPGDSSNGNSITILTYAGTAEIDSSGRNGMKGVITIYYTKSS